MLILSQWSVPSAGEMRICGYAINRGRNKRPKREVGEHASLSSIKSNSVIGEAKVAIQRYVGKTTKVFNCEDMGKLALCGPGQGSSH